MWSQHGPWGLQSHCCRRGHQCMSSSMSGTGRYTCHVMGINTAKGFSCCGKTVSQGMPSLQALQSHLTDSSCGTDGIWCTPSAVQLLTAAALVKPMLPALCTVITHAGCLSHTRVSCSAVNSGAAAAAVIAADALIAAGTLPTSPTTATMRPMAGSTWTALSTT
jgi:hypothetical protein